MLNFVGIAVEDLYRADVELYARARDAFISASAQRIGALRTHKAQVNNANTLGRGKHVVFLHELETKSQQQHRHYAKVKEHINKFSKLCTPPVNLDEDINEDQANALLCFVLEFLPDVGLRLVLDEDGLLLFVTHTTLAEKTTGVSISPETIQSFVAANKAALNRHTPDTAGWVRSVKEHYWAAHRKSLQNANDHLRLLRRTGLTIDHTANDVYLAALQVAYLLDLYLIVNAMSSNPQIEKFKIGLGSELAGALDILLEAPDPNIAANDYFAEQSQCLPILSCFNSRCTKPGPTQRELQLRREAYTTPRLSCFGC